MSHLLILTGTDRKAAEIFQDMHYRITGGHAPIADDRADDGVSDLVLIGSDADHFKCHELIMTGVLDSLDLRCGSDDYRILSLREKQRSILILAGGRPRSNCYAVYDYFERFCGCRYFWDGDHIPERESLPMNGIDFCKRFRNRYRGIRYFAHRSLHRFQAEHWSWNDWKTELDYLMKKRFNLFLIFIYISPFHIRDLPRRSPPGMRRRGGAESLSWGTFLYGRRRHRRDSRRLFSGCGSRRRPATHGLRHSATRSFYCCRVTIRWGSGCRCGWGPTGRPLRGTGYRGR